MIRSMTGYGRDQQLLHGRSITVEIRSVNHRYFEFSCRAPRGCAFLEDRLKRALQSAISRGKVEVALTLQTVESRNTSVAVDHALAGQYITALRALGEEYALLTPGNYGSDFIRQNLDVDLNTAVQVSNFLGDALDICRALGFRGALLIGHIGKLVKLAGGMWNTHSKFGDCRMEIIASHSAALGLRAERTEEILHCATCDDALRILDEEGLKDAFLVRLGQRIGTMLGYKSGELQSGAILFSKEYGFLCETEHAEELLKTIREG